MKNVFEGRRQLLKAGLGGFALALPVWGCATRQPASAPLMGFRARPASTANTLVVPQGYRPETLYAWGNPWGIAAGMPDFRFDSRESAADQALQAGMRHGRHRVLSGSQADAQDRSALLAIDHEYTEEGLLHPDGMRTWSAEKEAQDAQKAHGVSVNQEV